MNWRRSELISIGTMLVVAGWIWAASAKNAKIDRMAQQIDDKETGIIAHERRIIKVEEAVVYLKTLTELKEREHDR